MSFFGDSGNSSFLGQLRKHIGSAIQWLPKGAIKPIQVQPSESTGYVLTTTANGAEWQAGGGGGAALSNASPVMNGTASAGVGTLASRDDHVHPTDTSRASVASLAGYLPLTGGALTGPLTAYKGTAGNVLTTYATNGVTPRAYIDSDGTFISRAASTSFYCFDAGVTGDTSPRITLTSSGRIQFGTGAAVEDIFMYRNGTKLLFLDGSLQQPYGPAMYQDTIAANTTLSDTTGLATNRISVAGVVLTLPATPTTGRQFHVSNSSAGDASIAGNGKTIGGAASYTINAGESVWIQYSGVLNDWALLARSTTGVTQATSDNSTRLATTAFVKNQSYATSSALAGYLPLAGGTMAGAIAMATFKITGLGAGTVAGNALRYEQLFKTGTVQLLDSLLLPGVITVGAGTVSTVMSTDAFGVRQSGDLQNRHELSATNGLRFGVGSAAPDVQITRTAANEITLASGDVLRHDTAPENSANTITANTAYVDRATGSASSNRPSCKVYRSAALPTLTSGTPYVIPWDAEVFDTENLHSVSVNTDRLTIGSTGTYQVNGGIGLGTSTTGYYWSLKVEKYNVAGVFQEVVFQGEDRPAARSAATYVSPTRSATIQCIAGDYLKMTVQTDLTGLGIYTGVGMLTFLDVAWVGGTGAAWGNAEAKLQRSAAMSVPNGSWSDVTFDAVVTSTGMTTGLSTSPITCIIPGKYQVSAASAFVNSSGGSTRGHRIIHKNSAGTILAYICVGIRPGNGSNYSDSTTSDEITMASGDFLQLQVFQDSGAALNTSAGSGTYSLVLSAVRVGYQTNPTASMGTPTFAGTWANYGGGFQTASYAKVGNIVSLDGLVKRTGTSGLTVFTLPVGYRPAAQVICYPASTSLTIRRMDIDTLGNLVVSVEPGVAIAEMTLSGISFNVA